MFEKFHLSKEAEERLNIALTLPAKDDESLEIVNEWCKCTGMG